MLESLWLDFARTGFCAAMIVFLSGYVVGYAFRFVLSILKGRKL